jgi:hypothetical protein
MNIISISKPKRKDLPMNIIPISKQRRKDLPMRKVLSLLFLYRDTVH